MAALLSMVALEVVVVTNYGATNDGRVGFMTTLDFH